MQPNRLPSVLISLGILISLDSCALKVNAVQLMDERLRTQFMNPDTYMASPTLHRPKRSSFESDPTGHNYKPELQASHEQNHTQLKCTVHHPLPDSDVYISCPALGSTLVTGPCYQGCRPTKTCVRNTEPRELCVPHERTVFCKKSQFPNGTIILTLQIKRTDPRLAGVWSCTHGGLESTKFEIGLEKTTSKTDEQPTKVPPKTLPTAAKPSDQLPLEATRASLDQQMGDRPLAYMSKPAIVFSVLAVLILSLLINLTFCVRCLMMRSYIDASHEGASNAECLANCLCIPKDMRKSSSLRMAPVLPKSTSWIPQASLNGSYQSSTPIMYPSNNISKLPLIMGQQTPNELTGTSYIPTGSLPGTLRRHAQARFYGNPSHLDIFSNSNFIYNPENVINAATAADLGAGLTYMPSYVRVPSVNAPSPNLSQRLISNNPNGIYQQQNILTPVTNVQAQPTDGQGLPQYYLRMPQALLGGHVVYDDVAAGTSSILGHYNRSPNGSMVDNPVSLFPLPSLYHFQQAKAANSSETTPLLSSNRSNGPQVDVPDLHNGHAVQQPVTVNAQPNSQPTLPPLSVQAAPGCTSTAEKPGGE
ncbi:hypothetical protein PHET_02969 [Paragonimus heterotremus]|uniref:Sushi domain-containing protein n=1 Tax=Paragonimus heterotremus TaxID=100268 RepID=A0A8J4WK13_9TREM|nr:hypothetical protein PHET_02969 [Paragonimus heterotremus]